MSNLNHGPRHIWTPEDGDPTLCGIGIGGISLGLTSGGRSAGVQDPLVVLGSAAKLRLRADTVVKNGSNQISQWTDQTSAVQHFVQATDVDKPLSVASGINGKPIVRTNGANTILTSSGFPALTEAELFAVLQCPEDPSTVPNGQGGIWAFGSEFSNDQFPDIAGGVLSGWGSTARKTCGDPAAALTSARLLNIRSAAGAWSIWIDGVQLFTTGTNTVGFTATPQIGRSATVWSKIDFGEIIIANAVVSAATRTKIHAYVHSYWGLTIA